MALVFVIFIASIFVLCILYGKRGGNTIPAGSNNGKKIRIPMKQTGGNSVQYSIRISVPVFYSVKERVSYAKNKR